MVRTMIEHVKGYSPVDVALRRDEEVSEFVAAKVAQATARLLSGEPVQYIFGDTYWHGLTLKVTPATLIPRPETSELVDMIVRQNAGRRDLRVLDVGTGSGCIAVALARWLDFPYVRGVDISAQALEVARQNARLCKVDVDFVQEDAFALCGREGDWDVIVSNPPYIAESEKADMERGVLDHEPAVALFVPDGDPVVFYRAIVDYASKGLRPDGRIYFEINPLFAAQTLALFTKGEWDEVVLSRDMYGKERFISARLCRG